MLSTIEELVLTKKELKKLANSKNFEKPEMDGNGNSRALENGDEGNDSVGTPVELETTERPGELHTQEKT